MTTNDRADFRHALSKIRRVRVRLASDNRGRRVQVGQELPLAIDSFREGTINVSSPTGISEIAVRVLFLCSQNRLRSPTAEMVSAEWPGVECTSAGTNRGADTPLLPELIEWAEIIFCMEKQHQRKLLSSFRSQLKTARVICLGIPDDYRFMQPELVSVLQRKVVPYLR